MSANPGHTSSAKPFWSVMIPTYNPDDYLLRVLDAVLVQDRGAEQMQITVVDDASPRVDTAEFVRKHAGARVEVFVQPRNRGLAGNWNTCIERARGDWVHILHQDDLIDPAFYSEMEALAAKWPDAGALFCRHDFINGAGQTTGVIETERSDAGVIPRWTELIFTEQRLQCPSIVVRSAAYAKVGPFREDLCYTLDWDMWKRLAANVEFAYSPRILASYRMHDNNETARLGEKNLLFADMKKSIKISRGYVPEPDASKFARLASKRLLEREANRAWFLLGKGDPVAAKRSTWRLLSNMRWTPATFRLAACVVRDLILGPKRDSSAK